MCEKKADKGDMILFIYLFFCWHQLCFVIVCCGLTNISEKGDLVVMRLM